MYNPELWQRLSSFEIDDGPAACSFADRLAAEQGWSKQYAQRVIDEYKRFLYLAMTAGHQVTPSKAVDEAWHLHLTYTRSYWDRLCKEVLGRPLHHYPSNGSDADAEKYAKQYERTLASYQETFAVPPPADVWPRPNSTEPHLTTYQLAYLNGGIINVTATALTRLYELGLVACGADSKYQRVACPIEQTVWERLEQPASFTAIARGVYAKHHDDLKRQLIELRLLTDQPTPREKWGLKLGLGLLVVLGCLLLATIGKLFGNLSWWLALGIVLLYLFGLGVFGRIWHHTHRLRRTRRGVRLLSELRRQAQTQPSPSHQGTSAAGVVALLGTAALAGEVYESLRLGMPNETLIRQQANRKNKDQDLDLDLDLFLDFDSDDGVAVCGGGDFEGGFGNGGDGGDGGGGDGGDGGGGGCGGGCGGGD
jgi:uncharacterized protein (TIGR04222 family)